MQTWLIYSIITTLSWGVWGAFMEFPGKWGFPETLGYVVWALTMIPCAIVALKSAGWKLNHDLRSIAIGSAVGLLGAGGQLLLFLALKHGPAYVIFPIISLYPTLTVFLSVTILKESASKRTWFGICLALVAMVCLSYQPPSATEYEGQLWIILCLLIFLSWGVQTFIMKFATSQMSAESLFFYMSASGVILIPIALAMTDFSKAINYGFNGPYLSSAIQILNSIGALTIVYALRYGRAIVVVPMTSLAPVITVLMSLVIYGVIPHAIVASGMGLAAVAIYFLSLES